MITRTIGSQPRQANKIVQLNDKMLDLAQKMFLKEILNDNLFACDGDFTCKAAGSYGMHETFNGKVISFQPKSTLNFTLSYAELTVTGNLTTIEVVAWPLNEYNLSFNAA